jgi:lariat debranching enzyme
MVRVAVVGCCHGELNELYRALAPGVDLVLVAGDFQALRNRTDLRTISVPDKYKRLGDFHEYYSGKRRAPVLTVFIGGNHECSSYLQELRYGGFVAPNIFYLGEFGAVRYRGLVIAGQSGIWNEHSFMQRDAVLPYNASTLRSAYHTRAKTFVKSYLMHTPGKTIDVALSHDWPQGIAYSGNLGQLLKQKPFFRADIELGKLGSPLARILLSRLRARYWFSAHLHVRFEATVAHKRRHSGSSDAHHKKAARGNAEEIALDMDEPATGEIALDMDQPGDVLEPAKSPDMPARTKFLALDKCLPRRKFMEYIDISGGDSDAKLYFDTRAIAINKVMDRFVDKCAAAWRQVTKQQLLHIDASLPELVAELTKEVDFEERTLNRLPAGEFEADPARFKVIAPVEDTRLDAPPLQYWSNNQTDHYIETFLKE